MDYASDKGLQDQNVRTDLQRVTIRTYKSARKLTRVA